MVGACESDFLSDDTEEGEWREPDDEPVAMGQTAEGKPMPSSVTFGMVRLARDAINALMPVDNEQSKRTFFQKTRVRIRR